LADGHAVRCRLDVRQTEAVRLYGKRRFRLSALWRVEFRQFRDRRIWRIRQRNRNLDQFLVYLGDVELLLSCCGNQVNRSSEVPPPWADLDVILEYVSPDRRIVWVSRGGNCLPGQDRFDLGQYWEPAGPSLGIDFQRGDIAERLCRVFVAIAGVRDVMDVKANNPLVLPASTIVQEESHVFDSSIAAQITTIAGRPLDVDGGLKLASVEIVADARNLFVCGIQRNLLYRLEWTIRQVSEVVGIFR